LPYIAPLEELGHFCSLGCLLHGRCKTAYIMHLSCTALRHGSYVTFSCVVAFCLPCCLQKQLNKRTLFFHRIASNALQSEGHLFAFSEVNKRL
jgi:hypothetical protein